MVTERLQCAIFFSLLSLSSQSTSVLKSQSPLFFYILFYNISLRKWGINKSTMAPVFYRRGKKQCQQRNASVLFFPLPFFRFFFPLPFFLIRTNIALISKVSISVPPKGFWATRAERGCHFCAPRRWRWKKSVSWWAKIQLDLGRLWLM